MCDKKYQRGYMSVDISLFCSWVFIVNLNASVE